MDNINENDTPDQRPLRPDWISYRNLPAAPESDYLKDRPDIVSDEARFNCPVAPA